MSKTFRACPIAVAVASATVAAGYANAATYSSPYTVITPGTPGTPGTPAVPASNGALQTSFAGALDANSPTFNRPNAAGTELAPTPATTTNTGAYRYATSTFTPTASGSYAFYSAQNYDGYLHLYANAFAGSTPLVNNVANNDDMTNLNGGVVPNRGGLTTTSLDSGFVANLTANTAYTVVTSSFSPNFSAGVSGSFYNEIYRYNPATPAVPGTAPTPATTTPNFTVPDNTTVGVSVTINVPDSGIITSFDSLTMLNLRHTFAGDLDVTLSHNGTSVLIVEDDGGASDLLGDYTFIETGAALPTSGTPTTPVPSGTYDSQGVLASFVGMDIGGAWTLTFVDDFNGDIGMVSAFSFNAQFAPVPEPMAASASLALLGSVALRRRRGLFA